MIHWNLFNDIFPFFGRCLKLFHVEFCTALLESAALEEIVCPIWIIFDVGLETCKVVVVGEEIKQMFTAIGDLENMKKNSDLL